MLISLVVRTPLLQMWMQARQGARLGTVPLPLLMLRCVQVRLDGRQGI
jgi:hypothetical protein